MKLNQSTLAAAALAGLFAVGTAANAAQDSSATPSSITGEKEKCSGKDGCDGKEKKKEDTISVTAEEKAKCSGKDKCNSKDKDKEKEKCSGKEGCEGKDKKKEGAIL
ncbi:MAG: hypothetical protein Q8Q59_04020 [Luteolibacter sp.]|jgi:hypothetical protein|nr:hypothetical protein [Luteolibacter sp.]